jgi:hypothetical protein
MGIMSLLGLIGFIYIYMTSNSIFEAYFGIFPWDPMVFIAVIKGPFSECNSLDYFAPYPQRHIMT